MGATIKLYRVYEEYSGIQYMVLRYSVLNNRYLQISGCRFSGFISSALGRQREDTWKQHLNQRI